jgi:DICT domain-containing protein
LLPQFSLYQQLKNTFGNRLEPQLQRKSTLITLSHALENVVVQNGLQPLILTAFQHSRYYEAEKERYAKLKESAKAVLLYGKGLSDNIMPINDWFLVISEPRFKALLTCAEFINEAQPQVVTSKCHRTFLTLWSCEAEVVDFACRMLTDLDHRTEGELKTTIGKMLAEPHLPLEQAQLMRSVSENILAELEFSNLKALHQISHNQLLLQQLENQEENLSEIANAKAETEGKLQHLRQELNHLYNDVTRSQTFVTTMLVEQAQQEQKKIVNLALLEQLKVALTTNIDNPQKLSQINLLIAQLQQNL